ncbi:MAG: hypothetical protein Athens071424_52 [Parcubacteria group bacterium Athens0714_24]|nr:MAG: hypothetical protein Athens071424_52 [Parcubacteria group bacterium Athens0714_24]
MRMGECNRCGACCLGGWKKPCPNAEILPDYTIRCKLWDKLGKQDDREVLETCGVLTSRCRDFPHVPPDLFTAEIRNKCDYYFVEIERILVTCPVHECKEYSFQKWIDAVKSLTYPNYEIFVVDNSPSLDFMNRYKDQVPMEHIEVDQSIPVNRITKSMEVIRQKFLKGDYDRWFNIECDVIAPPNTIEVFLENGKGVDWIGHAYPTRGSDQKLQSSSGIGCSMFTKKLMENYNFDEADRESPDCWLWDRVRGDRRFKTMELWNYLETKHLDK